MVKAILVLLCLVALLALIWWAASAPAKGPGARWLASSVGVAAGLGSDTHSASRVSSCLTESPDRLPSGRGQAADPVCMQSAGHSGIAGLRHQTRSGSLLECGSTCHPRERCDATGSLYPGPR